MKDKICTLIKEFFDKIEINYDSIEVNETDRDNIFNVKIITNESGLIIGPHGKNLDSIQSILKLMSSNVLGEKVRLHLEINDYIKTKDDRLLDFIKKEISYLEKTGKDIKLPFYSPYERKKIHGFVAEMNLDGIYTKSMGEGKERRLYLCKQGKKLTIDIDGDDI